MVDGQNGETGTLVLCHVMAVLNAVLENAIILLQNIKEIVVILIDRTTPRQEPVPSKIVQVNMKNPRNSLFFSNLLNH